MKYVWPIVKFGDVVKNVNLVERDPLDAGLERFVGLDHLEGENLHIRRWGLIDGSDTTFTKLFRRGQVLFGKRRAYQRKVAVAEFDGICSSDILTFEPKGDTLIPELLPFIVQSDGFFEHALGTSAGSLSPRTRWSQLADYTFPLPPKDEQRRIADILWAADGAYQGAISVCRSLELLLRTSVLDALRGTVTGSGNAGYVQVSLGDLFKDRRETGFPQLPILSVTIDGRVVRRESLERQVIDKTGNDKYLRVVEGDIAYNTMRMWQGSCGIVGEEGIISPAYTVLIPDPRRADARYWHFAFHTPEMLEWFRRYSTGVAADRWRLYYRDFGKIRVHAPPLGKQRSLARVFQDLEVRIGEATAHVDTTGALMKTLINSLTVPSAKE